MGKNIISTDGVLTLIERMAACNSIQEVHVEYVVLLACLIHLWKLWKWQMRNIFHTIWIRGSQLVLCFTVH